MKQHKAMVIALIVSVSPRSSGGAGNEDFCEFLELARQFALFSAYESECATAG